MLSSVNLHKVNTSSTSRWRGTQGRLHIAISFATMVRHFQILADELDLHVRKKIYNHEKWQRRWSWEPEHGKASSGRQALSRSEAILDLQSTILYQLAQAENSRKGLSSGKATMSNQLPGNEQLQQELLITTFAHGL